MPYNDSFEAEDQIDAEEWIAAHIADTVNELMFDASLSDKTAGDMGRDILYEIIRRFRSDLLDTED